MAHAQRVENVRHLIAQSFARLGLEGTAEARESILIRGGIYCGRRFDVPSGYAIWFAEEDEIVIYKADGSITQVTEVPMADAAYNRAA